MTKNIKVDGLKPVGFLFQNFQINQKININKPRINCNNNRANAN